VQDRSDRLTLDWLAWQEGFYAGRSGATAKNAYRPGYGRNSARMDSTLFRSWAIGYAEGIASLQGQWKSW
jgi:hypothetical protein